MSDTSDEWARLDFTIAHRDVVVWWAGHLTHLRARKAPPDQIRTAEVGLMSAYLDYESSGGRLYDADEPTVPVLPEMGR